MNAKITDNARSIAAPKHDRLNNCMTTLVLLDDWRGEVDLALWINDDGEIMSAISGLIHVKNVWQAEPVKTWIGTGPDAYYTTDPDSLI